MNKRELGVTGLEVSEMAFGGAGIGMPYANQPMPLESESIHLLHRAVEDGINFFDTARGYGKSEYLMGKAFNSMRSDVVLSSKCVHLLDESGNLPENSVLDKTIRQSLEKSLEALQTEYIDVYMLHQSNMKIIRDSSVANIFSELKKEGKVRAIGVSTYRPEETKVCLDSGLWDVVQVPFNLLDQSQQKYFDRAKRNGIGIIVRSVLFRGMLSGRSLKLHPALKEVESHIKKYDQLLSQKWPDLVTLATKFALSYEAVSSVLIGIDKMEYLNKAIDITEGFYMDSDERRELESMAYSEPDFLNLHQWNQKGWLKK